MNEVSIIINGVRYDAVEVDEPNCCTVCEFPKRYCSCCTTLHENQVFKKFDKKFEK